MTGLFTGPVYFFAEAGNCQLHNQGIFLIHSNAFLIQYRPVNIMTASRYAAGKEASLLLNTPFTILKTLGKNVLKPVYFFRRGKNCQFSSIVLKSPIEINYRWLPDTAWSCPSFINATAICIKSKNIIGFAGKHVIL